jgi:hypothetical protein
MEKYERTLYIKGDNIKTDDDRLPQVAGTLGACRGL